MSLSLSQLPELSNQEIWQEQWGQVKKLRDNLWGEAQTLIKKGRILPENKEDPDYINWSNLLVTIFEKRIRKDREDMRQTVAFHPFVGGTMFYGDKLPFDLPNDAIQKCAEQLLQELRRANSSENTEMIIF